MIELAEMLPPTPSALWTLARQMGLEYAVGGLPFDDPLNGTDAPWDFMPLLRMKQRYESVWCYEWMTDFNWLRTNTNTVSRGGSIVTSFDASLLESAPLTELGPISDEALWANLEYFLRKVVPVAEKANVKLAMHPDDPPLSPIRGVSRIMRSVSNYQRLVDLVPSPVNGITLCQGNFTLMTDDLPSVIRHFGALKKVFFVHFRDVRGTVSKFEETWHDAGKTDLLECMRAWREVGFDGVLRPDHVPTVEGDNNDRPGYSSFGRLYAIGYIRGLRQAVYAEG